MATAESEPRIRSDLVTVLDTKDRGSWFYYIDQRGILTHPLDERAREFLQYEGQKGRDEIATEAFFRFLDNDQSTNANMSPLTGNITRTYMTEVGSFQELETAIRNADLYEPGTILWQDDYYLRNQNGQVIRNLVQSLANSPEVVNQLDLDRHSATAARTISFGWHDSGGDCYVNFKGGFSVTAADTAEANDYLRRRIDIWSGRSGREINERADQEVTAFLHLLNRHPDLLYLNGPFWRPLIVVAGRGLGITHQINEETWEDELFADHCVVSARRFPYTVNRLDEYLYLRNLQPRSVEAMDILRRKWGYESDSPVFLRAIERWGQAARMLREANMLHEQLFYLLYDLDLLSPGRKTYAQMNFNNMAIDGSTGDLDCAVIGPKTTRQMYEAVGGCLMYLAYVQRTKPDLVSSSQFLKTYFENFCRGLGTKYVYDIQTNLPSQGEINDFGTGNILDQVLIAIDRTVKLENDIYNPLLDAVTRRVRQVRGLLPI